MLSRNNARSAASPTSTRRRSRGTRARAIGWAPTRRAGPTSSSRVTSTASASAFDTARRRCTCRSYATAAAVSTASSIRSYVVRAGSLTGDTAWSTTSWATYASRPSPTAPSRLSRPSFHPARWSLARSPIRVATSACSACGPRAPKASSTPRSRTRRLHPTCADPLPKYYYHGSRRRKRSTGLSAICNAPTSRHSLCPRVASLHQKHQRFSSVLQAYFARNGTGLWRSSTVTFAS